MFYSRFDNQFSLLSKQRHHYIIIKTLYNMYLHADANILCNYCNYLKTTGI